jgi:two-component system, chemotaxis family, protein-glutamate methylesterase/glutaminase
VPSENPEGAVNGAVAAPGCSEATQSEALQTEITDHFESSIRSRPLAFRRRNVLASVGVRKDRDRDTDLSISDRKAVPVKPRFQSEAAHPGAPKVAAHAAFDVIAVAASAGGLNALSELLSALPADLPIAVVVVQHLDPRHRSLMADILSRRTRLLVKQADDGDHLEPGTVYVAPPNRHLLVNRDSTISLTQSELVHFVRPSADLLFESVAASHRDRAIAVVLSGSGSDGAMGVRAIKKMEGTVIAQDEQTSEFFGMPGAAIQTGSVDFILPLPDIAPALVTLVMKSEVE